MHTKKNRALLCVIAMLVIAFAISPLMVCAVSEPSPRASYYLDNYNTYIYPAGWGKIQVYFDVTGVTYMDDIGALTVQIYESTDQVNWTWVDTVRHTTQSNMLGHNDIYHSGHVDYSGTIGRYYKAYVTLWAGKDGDGDTRYMWTQPKKATLLPG